MPIFEYICNDCRQAFEVLVRGKNRVVCSHCGGKNIVKQFSAFATNTVSGAAPKCADSCESFAPGGAGCCGGHCHHNH